MQYTYLDAVNTGKNPTKASKFLEEIDKVIPWYRINKVLKDWKSSDLGRTGYTPERMFRMSLLKDFYGLSDAETEEMINDRISFRKFMQLGDNESSPDETSLCKFRAWMTQNSKQEKLFMIVNRYLNDKGCFVKKGTLVDATIIDAPKNKSNSEKKWMDEDASSTKKGSTWYRGYKAHMGLDFGSNLIADIITTTAKVTDTVVFDLLLPAYAKAVLADKGYYSKERKRQLRDQGIFCGILDKAARSKKLSNSQVKRNKKLAPARAFVEHPFNAIKNWFGFRKTRFVGIVKNTAQIFMLATLYNLHKVRKSLEPEPIMA